MSFILTNSILIVYYDDNKLEYQRFEVIFTYIYSIEIIMKIFGFGFITTKDSFLRSGWNILDFLIVVISYLTYYFNINFSFGFIRCIRFINVINSPKLKIMVESIISTIKILLKNTILILIIIGSFFAILGMQMFQGVLKYRCFNRFGFISIPETFCGSFQCDKDNFCAIYKNPDNESTNFDNFFSAYLQVFRIMTFNNWTELMNSIQKTFSNQIWIYFILIGSFGNYFLINLVLAVIKVEHSRFQQMKHSDFLKNIENKEVKKIDFKTYKERIIKTENYNSLQKKKTLFASDITKKNYILKDEDDYGYNDKKCTMNFNSSIITKKMKSFINETISYTKGLLKKVKIRKKKINSFKNLPFFDKKNEKSKLYSLKSLNTHKSSPKILISIVDSKKKYDSLSKGDVFPNWFF